MRHARRRIGSALIPILGPPLLRLLSRTWKLTEIDHEHYEEVQRQPGYLATMWHGRMLVPLPAYRDQTLRVLVSPSDDGSLAALLLRRFGYEVIRGSTNESPLRALRQMLRALKEGGSIVITPDGPRGPRHSMNAGPAWISRATGFPVIPVGCVCDRAWRMNSWDRFTIPKPGAHITLVFAPPIYVDRQADDAEVDRVTEEIQAQIIAAETRGFEHLGCERDW
jgi:lysophospholipid acyltransferase (LPLAT)-like uncharacterized protein